MRSHLSPCLVSIVYVGFQWSLVPPVFSESQVTVGPHWYPYWGSVVSMLGHKTGFTDLHFGFTGLCVGSHLSLFGCHWSVLGLI